MSLDGKVCIVTGASSGIGQAIAILFAERKASVVLCGRSVRRLENSYNKCVDVSPGHNRNKFITVLGDLTDAEVRDSIIDKTVKTFGRIDALVCNAGTVSDIASILDTTEEVYDQTMDVNVKSVFFLIKKAVSHLEKTRGAIVAVSSVMSHDTTPFVAYSTSKAAVDHMMRCCAAQFAQKGIRVNTVNPTLVRRTRIFRNMTPGMAEADDEQLKSIRDALLDDKAKIHSLGKRVAMPEDVARAVAFLVSAEASYITGQILDVDGGISVKSGLFPE